MKPADILLLTTDPETADTVRAAVKSGAVQGTTSVCRTMVELRSRLAKSVDRAHRVAVIDIDADPKQILYDLGKTIAGDPAIRVVVVSHQFNEQLVLQAMQAGARHFLRKSAVAVELDTVLGRLLLHEPHAPTQMGDIISVFSCSGGCGATTVAVNLAAELRLADERPVLLIDLDPHYGSVAQYLNLEGNYGVAHMLNREDAVDRHLVESSVIQYSEGLDVLLSPAVAEADKNRPMNYDHLLKVLDACRESHGYVVIDAPRLPRQAAMDLGSVSRIAVIVLRLTIRDVKFAKAMVELLTEQGMTPDRILLVANQTGRHGTPVKAAQVQQSLGVDVLVRVRTDWKKALRSTNFGQPLAHSARLSGLRRDLRKVARQVQQWTSNGRLKKGDA